MANHFLRYTICMLAYYCSFDIENQDEMKRQYFAHVFQG